MKISFYQEFVYVKSSTRFKINLMLVVYYDLVYYDLAQGFVNWWACGFSTWADILVNIVTFEIFKKSLNKM